jgi:hypothetical protein
MVLIWNERVQSSCLEDQSEVCSSLREAVRGLQAMGGSRRMPALEIKMSRWVSWERRVFDTVFMPSFEVRSQENLEGC